MTRLSADYQTAANRDPYMNIITEKLHLNVSYRQIKGNAFRGNVPERSEITL
jgi:hypothetical protein